MSYPGFKAGTFGEAAGSPNNYIAWSANLMKDYIPGCSLDNQIKYTLRKSLKLKHLKLALF